MLFDLHVANGTSHIVYVRFIVLELPQQPSHYQRDHPRSRVVTLAICEPSIKAFKASQDRSPFLCLNQIVAHQPLVLT